MDVATRSKAAGVAVLLARAESVRMRIVALRGWRRRGAAVAAGVAAALAFAPFYLLPLMAAGFSTLLFLLDGARDGARPLRTGFFLGWLFGFGYFLAGLYWMAFSFFVQADEFAWMAPFAMTGLPAFLALFVGAACALTVAAARRGWNRALFFIAAFSALEYARGHVLTGLPWNTPAQALAGTAAGAQTAAWWGAWGLGVVVMLAAVAPAWTPGARGLLRGALASVGLVLGLLGVGALRLAAGDYGVNDGVVVRIVQPNIPQRQKIDETRWTENFLHHVELSRAPAPAGKQVFIVWPENATPWLAEQPQAVAHLGAALPDRSVLLLGTVRSETKGGKERFFNTISAWEKNGASFAPTAHYDKHHLVPFGEYLPLSRELRAVGLAQLAPYEDGFTPGPGPATLSIAGSRVAPLVCYETIFAGALYPRGDRPDWLVTATNDAWFGDTSGPRQHLDQARLRAIETALPMARSANTGISALIDGKGRYVRRIALYEQGVIEAPLPKAGPRTLYDRLGDWPFGVMVVLVLAGAIARPEARRA